MVTTNETTLIPLQPRPATIGNHDSLQLHPRLLPNFEHECGGGRETRSEPREMTSCRTLSCVRGNANAEPDFGVASIPAMAIGSSTEILVSILENQTGLRRNSFLTIPASDFKSDGDTVLEMLSPDCDFVKSPSTEMTNPSEHSETSRGSCVTLNLTAEEIN